MKKNGLQFLTLTVLAAIVAGACLEPFDALKEPVEYDAQGRRLVKVTVDLGSAARAVNTPVAQAYIDFYEVVFKGPGAAAEYYSAVATKGAGRRLSLRVPVGTYIGYLNAGYFEDSSNAVLLAQAAPVGPQDASASWNFALTALKLQVNGPASPASPGSPGTSKSTDPIYVTFAGADAAIQMTSGGIPYYAPATTVTTVAVAVATGATNVVDYGANNAVVTPLIRKSDAPPVIISITPSPSFDAGTGKLTFGFAVPGAGAKGLSNVGFDVTVAAVSLTRNNGLDPVHWHIRNGLNVDSYDNGKDNDVGNTGAGLVFAFGSATPSATDTYGISFAPPTIP
jgi:hypothetical protein